jgi:hypothetical protein
MLNRSDYESIREELELSGIDFTRPCMIAIDEIRLVETLPGLVKYLYELWSKIYRYRLQFLLSKEQVF